VSAGFPCACGHWFDEAQSPEPDGYIAYSDEDFLSILDALEASVRLLVDETSTNDNAIWSVIDETYRREGGIITARHCPVCGRLHVFTGDARLGNWQHRVWLPEPELTITEDRHPD
jgi:hypothetical protein